jgi:hypothetical protein
MVTDGTSVDCASTKNQRRLNEKSALSSSLLPVKAGISGGSHPPCATFLHAGGTPCRPRFFVTAGQHGDRWAK